jgi:hypothetical protein
LPDLPTAAEQGVQGFVAVNWIGVIAPARTPQPVIDKLHAAFGEGRWWTLQLARRLPHSRNFIGIEDEKWAGIVKAAGVDAE